MQSQTLQGELWNALNAENDNADRLMRLSVLLRSVMQEELTERQRNAFLLHVGQGVSQKEIATMWQVHPSVVCRHIQQAKARIRRWTGKLSNLEQMNI